MPVLGNVSCADFLENQNVVHLMHLENPWVSIGVVFHANGELHKVLKINNQNETIEVLVEG
jgi:hypothetical protein